MANVKISELPAAGALTGAEQLALVQAGATVAAPASALLDGAVDGDLSGTQAAATVTGIRGKPVNIAAPAVQDGWAMVYKAGTDEWIFQPSRTQVYSPSAEGMQYAQTITFAGDGVAVEDTTGEGDFTVTVAGDYLPLTGGSLTGALGVATTPPADATSKLFVDGDFSFAVGNSAVLFNTYFDTVAGTFKNVGVGYSGYVKSDNGAGDLIFASSAGSAAAGAANTPTIRLSIDSAGFIKPAGLVEAADDAAASAGGVPIGALYRSGSTVKIRVA